ncbi:hypothetical protein ACWDKQ_00755 [Saccharopolyspora sp. NPDC000995]
MAEARGCGRGEGKRDRPRARLDTRIVRTGLVAWSVRTRSAASWWPFMVSTIYLAA